MPVLLTLPSVAALAIITMILLLTYAWEATFGALLEDVANKLRGVSFKIKGLPRLYVFAPLIVVIDGLNSVVHRLSAVAGRANTWLWNQFVHHLALAWQAIGESIDDVSRETAAALDYLRHHKIPALIALTTGPLGLLIYAQRDRIAALAADIARIAAHPGRLVTHTIERVKVIERRTVKIITQTVPAAVTKAIAVPFPRLGRVEREAGAARAWIKSHARLLVGAGLAGLVVAALGKLGLGWTRCSRVGKVGRSVCGMNSDYLDDLLAASLAIFGTISLVEVAKEMQGITDEITAAVRVFTRAA